MKDYKQLKRKVNNNLIYFLLYLVIILFFASIIVQSLSSDKPNTIFGHTIRLVVSGSMEPEIKTNSINIIRTCDIKYINIGDIICFKYKNDIVHRVVDKKTDQSGNIILNTKGDNNNAPDSIEICEDMIVGKVVYTWNGIAPTISKYSISSGQIDSIALSRNIIIYGMLIGIIALAVVEIINYIIVFIKSISKSKNTEEILETYISDIDELIAYREILNDILNKSIRNSAETRFEYIGMQLAKAKIIIECKGIHNDIRGFKRGIKKAIFMDKILTSLDKGSNSKPKKEVNIYDFLESIEDEFEQQGKSIFNNYIEADSANTNNDDSNMKENNSTIEETGLADAIEDSANTNNDDSNMKESD